MALKLMNLKINTSCAFCKGLLPSAIFVGTFHHKEGKREPECLTVCMRAEVGGVNKLVF